MPVCMFEDMELTWLNVNVTSHPAGVFAQIVTETLELLSIE